MRNRSYLVMFLFLILSLPGVLGAVVQGTVYDFSLDRVDSVKVEINTTPAQRDITDQGSYRFMVKPGTYTLRAEQIEDGTLIAMTEEFVTVTGEGEFVVDLILFPELDEPLNIPDDLDVDEDLGTGTSPWALGVLAALALFGAGWYFWKRFHVFTPANETHDLLDFITTQGGRTTQKEIRKAFPYSEAKISLILTELESQQKIKKIKKGRGNVIVLA